MFGYIYNGEGGQNPLSKVAFEKKFVLLLLFKPPLIGGEVLESLDNVQSLAVFFTASLIVKQWPV